VRGFERLFSDSEELDRLLKPFDGDAPIFIDRKTSFGNLKQEGNNDKITQLVGGQQTADYSSSGS